MVTPLSRRRPAVVAKHLMTLDHLSGGRVTLGVGLGDPPDLDFSDFGDEPSYRVRAAITDEALDGAGRAAGDGSVSHQGEHLDGRGDDAAAAGAAPRSRSGSPAARPTSGRWSGRAGGTATSRSPSAFLHPDALAAYVGEHPRDEWDLVAQWPDGTSPDEYAAAGATWLVRSTWPREEGWRDELESLTASPPA